MTIDFTLRLDEYERIHLNSEINKEDHPGCVRLQVPEWAGYIDAEGQRMLCSALAQHLGLHLVDMGPQTIHMMPPAPTVTADAIAWSTPLGWYVAMWRQGSGDTCKTLGKTLGCSAPFISEMEHGKRLPSRKLQARMIQAGLIDTPRMVLASHLLQALDDHNR